MYKKQFSKIAELPDGYISTPCCLKTFHSADANSHMRRLNHRNIVSTITNSEKDRFEILLHQLDHESFLQRGDPADDEMLA